jgi:hypothetical protein
MASMYPVFVTQQNAVHDIWFLFDRAKCVKSSVYSFGLFRTRNCFVLSVSMPVCSPVATRDPQNGIP